jgi:WbqC-like protein family
MEDKKNSTAILSTAYLAPIQYYSKLLNYSSCIIEHHEHFTKQTFRSRCDIYSPNGIKTLSVPLVKRNHRQAVKDLKISYDYDWQKLHWRTLESSYRRSPFFEYFEDDLQLYFHDKKFNFLTDLNEALQQEILQLLKLKANYSFSTEYKDTFADADDYRTIIEPKANKNADALFEPKIYSQVFETKHGFIPNLSILDLLFNQGSRAKEFI